MLNNVNAILTINMEVVVENRLKNAMVVVLSIVMVGSISLKAVKEPKAVDKASLLKIYQRRYAELERQYEKALKDGGEYYLNQATDAFERYVRPLQEAYYESLAPMEAKLIRLNKGNVYLQPYQPTPYQPTPEIEREKFLGQPEIEREILRSKKVLTKSQQAEAESFKLAFEKFHAAQIKKYSELEAKARMNYVRPWENKFNALCGSILREMAFLQGEIMVLQGITMRFWCGDIYREYNNPAEEILRRKVSSRYVQEVPMPKTVS